MVLNTEKEKKRSAGFTLIELMIALAISSIVVAAMYAVFQAQVRGQVAQDVSLQMTQSVRAAMEIIVADIRMAGCDPTEEADARIETADSDNLIFTMDTGDGATAGARPNGSIEENERIRYAINTNGNLGRATGTGNPPSPLHTLHSVDLECDTLEFVYFDREGAALGTPVADTEAISAIQVTIVVRSIAHPDRWFQLSNTIARRNT